MGALNTGIKNVKNVSHYTIGEGSLSSLSERIKLIRDQHKKNSVLFFVDEFFSEKQDIIKKLDVGKDDQLFFISTINEPTTQYIDQLCEKIQCKDGNSIVLIVGMGGGITMDIAKSVANLLTNKGSAADYQGWDLVKVPGVYKIAIPTLSGTGAEATRTCVMTNKSTSLKLGMNSDYTVFDQIIMDSELTKTVPKNQYFYTGMDAYIHCMEALSGSYRNAIGDAYSYQTISLCREVFNSDNMMSDDNRSKMMVASYLGGCAIATSYVGVVHPFSAGLSVVLNIHHCIANCIVMRAMEEFYPDEYVEFWAMTERQGVKIPKNICNNLTSSQYDQLYESTIIHEKPLINALGDNFREKLTRKKVIDIFKKM